MKKQDIIAKTQSICPICQRPADAYYYEKKGRVYISIECSKHEGIETLAAENAEDFKRWTESPVINIPPKVFLTKADAGGRSCPLNCGPCEKHLQTACCVLIDVTNRCNQHCPYCFARADEAGYVKEPALSEIEQKLDRLLLLGEDGREFNLQLSGGEPTVREDLPDIITLASRKGFRYIQINSNGKRIAHEEGYARALREAGASVIFMQFDGTRDDIYEELRGEPLFETKLKAIRNCEDAGLAVTLVPTVVRGINDDNIGEMMEFLKDNVNVVKGIHFQPASFFGRFPEGDQRNGRITMFGLLRKLQEQSPQFKISDSMPISTGHPLCCFYSTYIKEPDGSIRCTLSKKAREDGLGCCSSLDLIKKDRDYVLNKWDVSAPKALGEEKYTSSLEITDLDEFLSYYRLNTFTVTGMAFMDGSNLDAERLKRCRVVQLTDDGRLIPFCAYNTIYREELNK